MKKTYTPMEMKIDKISVNQAVAACGTNVPPTSFMIKTYPGTFEILTTGKLPGSDGKEHLSAEFSIKSTATSGQGFYNFQGTFIDTEGNDDHVISVQSEIYNITGKIIPGNILQQDWERKEVILNHLKASNYTFS